MCNMQRFMEYLRHSPMLRSRRLRFISDITRSSLRPMPSSSVIPRAHLYTNTLNECTNFFIYCLALLTKAFFRGITELAPSSDRKSPIGISTIASLHNHHAKSHSQCHRIVLDFVLHIGVSVLQLMLPSKIGQNCILHFPMIYCVQIGIFDARNLIS